MGAQHTTARLVEFGAVEADGEADDEGPERLRCVHWGQGGRAGQQPPDPQAALDFGDLGLVQNGGGQPIDEVAERARRCTLSSPREGRTRSM